MLGNQHSMHLFLHRCKICGRNYSFLPQSEKGNLFEPYHNFNLLSNQISDQKDPWYLEKIE